MKSKKNTKNSLNNYNQINVEQRSTVSDHGRASGCESYQILTLENDENPLGRESSKVEANNFSS